MASTFVGIADAGFWVKDDNLELWLRLLALHIDEPMSPTEISAIIRNNWLLASRGYFGGCCPARLEEAVSTEEGKSAVIGAIHSLQNALQKAPDSIDKDALNLLGLSGEYASDPRTQWLLDIAQAFLDLIDGKFTTPASAAPMIPGVERYVTPEE